MTQNQKVNRIAVLLGGDSNEREISLESGRNVCYKLSPHKYAVTPIFINDNMELFKLAQKQLIKNSTREINALLTPDMQIQWDDLPNLFDFIFIGLHGGKGENGAIQGALEMLRLPYNGSGILASALCMDKFKTNNFLHAQGFHVPQSLLIQAEVWITKTSHEKETFCTESLASFSYPLIVKPHDDGCSIMVQKAKDAADLQTKLDLFFTTNKKIAMVEEFIHGTELTCGVIGNTTITALPPSKVIANKDILSIEEKFLPGEGENQTPAPLTPEALFLIKQTMEQAFITIGCSGYARIDCFYQDAHQSPTDKERVIILEFNTLPGLTPATCIFHQAAELGLKPMEFIDKIVELGFELHKGHATGTIQTTSITEHPKEVQKNAHLHTHQERKPLNKRIKHKDSPNEKIPTIEQTTDDPISEEARKRTLKLFS
jgi:D-alanine-D-alanine ligase